MSKLIIRRLSLFLIFTLVVTGCLADVVGSGPEVPIVVLWHSFSGEEGKALQNLGDRFNRDVGADFTLIVEYQEDIFEKVTSVDPERHPDLVVVSPEDLKRYHEAGLALPLPINSPAVAEEMTDLLPMARALYTVDGAMRALPLGLASYVLYYNVNWSRELGYDPGDATLTDLREAACAATNMEGGQIGWGVPSQPGLFLALLATGGVSPFDTTGSLELEQESILNSGNVLRALFDEGCGELFEVSDEGIQQFGNSTLAFLGGSTLQKARVEAAVAAESNFPAAVAPLPGLQDPGLSLWYGPGLLLLAPPGARRDAALEVIGWLLDPEAQRAWDAATQYLPVRRSLVAQQLTEEGDLRPLERGLLELALSAADEGHWAVLSASVVSEPVCRTTLVRSLINLSEGQSAEEVLQQAGQTCSKEVRP